jgi:putative aldouronate transport system permease protein
MFQRELPLYLMLIPPVILLLVYSYGPMFGLVMAFQKFEPVAGFFQSKWVGLANFFRVFSFPDIKNVIWNTFYISILKIVVETLAAIVVAICLNEVIQKWFKRTVQTIIYFPYFLSWVILGGVLRDILARDGVVNLLLQAVGIKPILFLGVAKIFPWVLVFTETWQITGFGTIVFLAAISSISPTLYEAAAIDGAGRLKQTWHITLPGMKGTIILMITMSMGYILNAGFDQILMLYSPLVYSTGDVIDTWVYRAGLQQAQYSLGAAVGLMRSGVSFLLVVASYYIAYKAADYRVF